ncbi:MAG: hypothetical protein EON58_05520 [Alphaproteobacteria bacterium]|nr:MAG: hypothetical protein EON58_05520 [Alphaproteobacteria bacterium]
MPKWHRRRILENTAQGRELAKSRGVRFGRKPKLSSLEERKVLERVARGEASAQFAGIYGVSGSTIYRLTKRAAHGHAGNPDPRLRQ